VAAAVADVRSGKLLQADRKLTNPRPK
jgi:hypothetical protein